MIQNLIFELIVYLERIFLKKNIQNNKGVYTCLYFNGDFPELVVLISNYKVSSGGTRTIFKLLQSYILDNRSILILFDSKLTQLHLNNISKDFDRSFVVKYERDCSKMIIGKKILFSNWQSYYSFGFLLTRTESSFFMIVQDIESLFFPASTISAYVKRAFVDKRIKYIALGKWVKNELNFIGSNCFLINFPITISNDELDFESLRIEKRNIFNSKSEIHILVYIKHSFRRAGGLLLSQLNKLPPIINGRRVVVNVIGYKPLLYKLSFKNHIKFLGHVSEVQISMLLVQATFGITYSMTNVSLLPFQMIKYSVIPLDLTTGTSKKTEIGMYVHAIEPSIGALIEFLDYALNNNDFALWYNKVKNFDYSLHELQNCSLEMQKIIAKN